MTDFAPKLAKVGAKLVQVGPSWPKVGLKLDQRCRQDDPKPVKSVATHNGNPTRSHRGAAREHTFGSKAPRDTLNELLSRKNQEQGHGTMDDDKI